MNLRGIIASSVAIATLAACTAGSVLPTSSSVNPPLNGAAPNTATTPAVAASAATSPIAANSQPPLLGAAPFPSTSAVPPVSNSGTPNAATATVPPVGSAGSNSSTPGTAASTPTASTSGTSTATPNSASSTNPSASPVTSNTATPISLGTAAPTVSPTTSTMPVSSSASGTQTINGQLIQGIPLADGSLISLTLPIIDNSAAVQYAAFTNIGGLPSQLIAPTTGTFVGGISVTIPNSFTIKPTAALSINIIGGVGVPSSTTYTAYYLSSGTPVKLYTQAIGAGTFTPQVGITLNADQNRSYTIAIYSNS